MSKEEFIGKLQLVYVGDRNAFDEIVEDNQKLKNELVYSKVEIDRLNNIIDELEKWLIEQDEYLHSNHVFEDYQLTYYAIILDKLKTLKENNKE